LGLSGLSNQWSLSIQLDLLDLSDLSHQRRDQWVQPRQLGLSGH
jgi:hypothetical protein